MTLRKAPKANLPWHIGAASWHVHEALLQPIKQADRFPHSSSVPHL